IANRPCTVFPIASNSGCACANARLLNAADPSTEQTGAPDPSETEQSQNADRIVCKLNGAWNHVLLLRKCSRNEHEGDCQSQGGTPRGGESSDSGHSSCYG